MKKKVGLTAAVLVLASSVFVSSGHTQGRRFSNRSLHGTYQVSFHGWVSGGDGDVTGQSLGPQNGVGLLTADGDGNFSDIVTANILYNTDGDPTSPSACGGSSNAHTAAVCNLNIVGTYSVNGDGTGTTTGTATPAPGSDCRCGASSGFSTTSSFVMRSPRQLSFVGTDLDATVSGEAVRREGGTD
jgi:hypothetical protein